MMHRPVGHAKARIEFLGVQVGDFEGVGWIAFRQAFGNLLRQCVGQRTWIIVIYNNQCVHGGNLRLVIADQGLTLAKSYD